MLTRQPFTVLRKALALRQAVRRIDLHIHTTHSDGLYTPAQVFDLAGRSGLAAVAITDHDSVAGLAGTPAGPQRTVELVPGVEISAEYAGTEVHVLGYFFEPEDAALGAALKRLREHRADRFWEMAERLERCGISLDLGELQSQASAASLGRRHLAELLVRARRAGSVREAFACYLHDGGRVAVPKLRLAVGDAIALIRGAGGIAAWAHPPYDRARGQLSDFRRLGLQALEVDFPACQPSRSRQLRGLAAEFGLAVTGGSDCHGPGDHRRAIGRHGVTAEELQILLHLRS
jgi:predicted metal-dependent phosphoesterase TrpH